MNAPRPAMLSSLRSLIFAVGFCGAVGPVFAAPVVGNLTASQRTGTKLVDITYDLAAPGFGAVVVTLEASSDGGATWTVPVTSVTGAVGAGVTPGTGKAIVWNAGVDWLGNYSTQTWFRVAAEGFSYIPGGSFTMGRTSGDTDADAPPITVTVSPFYIQQTETTKAQWDEVRTWGLSNGYTDLAVGAGKASNHPVQMVSWWDVVKWCNARSEKEGLTPVYTVGGAVMRTGTTAPEANWSANGYRLPTEAEWEKAARGGVSGKRFPWGTDTISHASANYYGSGISYDESLVQSYHPGYDEGDFPYTSPVMSFQANGHGLFDMAGNTMEWCWDWYKNDYYLQSAGSNDPLGPSSGTVRVLRGGGWGAGSPSQKCSFRDWAGSSGSGISYGFRSVRINASPMSAEINGVSLDTRSNDASLSALTLSDGALDPDFNAVTDTYTASVANAVSTVTVTATSSEPNAVIQVKMNDGAFTNVSSGNASGSRPLLVGQNVLVILVTAQDTVTTMTYTTTVMREKASQTIGFQAITDQLATASHLLDATGGGSGQPLVFVVESGPAVLGEGNILTFTGAGEVRVRASQAGNSDFNPATDVTHTFNIVLPQPDVAVGLSLDSLVGIRSYGNPGQQLNLVSRFARPVTGFAILANRTILPGRRAEDRLAVRANPGNRFFRVTYSDVDGNATAGIVSGFYRTPAIDGTDAIRWITARISPNRALLAAKKGRRTVYLRKTFKTTVRASSTLYPPASDSGVIRVSHH